MLFLNLILYLLTQQQSSLFFNLPYDFLILSQCTISPILNIKLVHQIVSNFGSMLLNYCTDFRKQLNGSIIKILLYKQDSIVVKLNGNSSEGFNFCRIALFLMFCLLVRRLELFFLNVCAIIKYIKSIIQVEYI